MYEDARMTQTTIDMLLLLFEHEGYSSGELSLISGINRNGIKAYMRLFEKMGYGEFTIFDGMYHFWFSPDGRKRAQELEDSN